MPTPEEQRRQARPELVSEAVCSQRLSNADFVSKASPPYQHKVLASLMWDVHACVVRFVLGLTRDREHRAEHGLCLLRGAVDI